MNAKESLLSSLDEKRRIEAKELIALFGLSEQSQLELLEAIRTDQKLIKFSEINGLIYLDKDGQYQYGAPRRNTENLDLLPVIDRHTVPESLEAHTATIYSSRGCPGRCIYCAAPAMSGGKYRIRDIENVFKYIVFTY